MTFYRAHFIKYIFYFIFYSFYICFVNFRQFIYFKLNKLINGSRIKYIINLFQPLHFIVMDL